MSAPLLILGSVAIDEIATTKDKVGNLLGGSASYASIAASLFTETRLVGIVGTDFPDEHRALFNGKGIDTRGLEVAEGKTFRWSGEYEKDMNNRRTVSVELNVFSSFSPQLPEALQETPYVLLANISPQLQLNVLNQLKQPKFVIADTMDLWIETTRSQLIGLLERVDLFILNDSEARLLSGEQDLIRAAEVLRGWGAKYVIIKKGEHGSCLFGEEGTFVAPAVMLDHVADPTGAGDAFVGGVAGLLAKTDTIDFSTLKKGIIEGTVLASFTVEDFGVGRLAALNMGEYEHRKQELQKLMSY